MWQDPSAVARALSGPPSADGDLHPDGTLTIPTRRPRDEPSEERFARVSHFVRAPEHAVATGRPLEWPSPSSSVGPGRDRRRSRRGDCERRPGDDHLPGGGPDVLHRRLRRPTRSGRPPGQRPHGRLEDLGGCRRARQGPDLHGIVERRLHALPVRQERNDVYLHSPQQRPHGQERQQGSCKTTGPSPTRKD